MPSQERKDESGQVMILTALLLTAFLGVSAFAIDGGFALFQSRQAQNAADFAALGTSKLMPCNSSSSSTTAAQVQAVAQLLVNDNDTSVGTNWTGKYLDGNGDAISGATFSGTSQYTPPSNACGVSIKVTGTWNNTLARVAGFNSASTSTSAGATGGGNQGANLAVASLLPYARHTIYAGAIGEFTVVGSMFDNSVAQCGNRTNACNTYSQCSSGTPTSNITCYGDSADVFQSATEDITGTLYSVAPVATDPCFYPSPTSGNDPAMTSTTYSSYYSTYGCGNQFSNAANAMEYGGIAGNSTAVGDPLASLADPSGNSGAATECPGASSPTDYSTSTFSSGSMNPGVYTNTVVITGSVTLNPCQSNGSTTAPGIYVFKKGLEICPASGDTVSGSDVTLYASQAPSNTYSNGSASNSGYCAPDQGPNSAVTDGITVGGASGSTVTLSASDTGVYKGILLYESRSTNENIGLDDGWFTTPGSQSCFFGFCWGSSNNYTADGANITLTGVVYDNSFTNEPSSEVFSAIGDSYEGPYGSLCTGSTSEALSGDPTPCPGIPSSLSIDNTSGTITINGAVIVGAFGTLGGSSGSPQTLTINFNSDDISISAGTLKLIF